MDTINIPVEHIRWAYPLLNKYLGFEYGHIAHEIFNSLPDFDTQTIYLNTHNIDHLPDDYIIHFEINDFDSIKSLCDKYDLDYMLSVLVILISIYARNVRNDFYGIESGCESYDVFQSDEKRKLYEFLLDNPHEFSDTNRAKGRIEIRLGLDSQISVDNYDNWLYNLILRSLNRDLTFDGRFEYTRKEEPQKPSRAPSFANYIAYNTFLLLKDVTNSASKFPAEISRFIIGFCGQCGVKLVGRHIEVIGMKEFLSHATRQYDGKPIPFSSVR